MRRAEELGEGRFELLRDQHERLELLHEERRMLLDELERERRERLRPHTPRLSSLPSDPGLTGERSITNRVCPRRGLRTVSALPGR